MKGPLHGVRVVELAGLGPCPFAAMLLADLGAEVVRVDRPPKASASAYEQAREAADPRRYPMNRGRRSIALDLRAERGREVALRLADRADVFLEGYRPGVAEKLGLGPEALMARNPRLVYGRMTGWGQDGPAASTAGHDLTYLAATGALAGLVPGPGATPVTPPPYLGDMGGGGVFLALGVASALWEVTRTGRGRVVDAAVVDGVSALTSLVRGLAAQGRWSGEPGTNFGDGGVPWYAVYPTADGGHVAVAALEEVFWQEFLRVLGPEADRLPPRDQPALLREHLAALFASRTREQWADLFRGTDACVEPVLSLDEAPHHPQLAARGSLVASPGGYQPAPVPRFDSSPADLPSPPPRPGQDTDEVLAVLGLDENERADLRAAGAVSG